MCSISSTHYISLTPYSKSIKIKQHKHVAKHDLHHKWNEEQPKFFTLESGNNKFSVCLSTKEKVFGSLRHKRKFKFLSLSESFLASHDIHCLPFNPPIFQLVGYHDTLSEK